MANEDGSVKIKVDLDITDVAAGVKDIGAQMKKAGDAADRLGKAVGGSLSGSQWGYDQDGAEILDRFQEDMKASARAVGEGLSEMTRHGGETAASLSELRAALTDVKLSLSTAFAPVLSAAVPLLLKLCGAVVKAANYVAMFFAVMSGKNSYKRFVAAQDAITDSVAGTGAAAKKTARNLSGLDELNIWQENKGGSGRGGGGGAGSDNGPETEEVEIGQVSSFLIKLRDILFEWDDLNPELIAEKILTGLCAAAGGIIGYTLGGPLGGVAGLTMGALLGVKLSDITFNGDGKINKEEGAKLVIAAALGLLGGVAGAMAGGPVGAAIGFTIGAGVSVKIGKALFNGDGKLDKTEVTKLILTALGGLIGGVLGFVIGGPLGAAIGFAVGAAITVALSGAVMEKGADLKEWVKEKVIGLVQKAVDAYHAVVEFGAKVINNAKEWWSSVKTWWGEKVGAVEEFATGVKNGAAAWWSSVKTWWSGKVGAVEEFATGVKNSATTWWGNVKTWWNGKVGAVRSFATGVRNSATTWWGNVKTWWSGKVGAVRSFTTSVRNNAYTWWSSVKGWWRGRVGAVQSFTTSVRNNASTWWSSVKGWWKGRVGAVQSFTTSVRNNASTWWSSVKGWWKGRVGAVQSFTTSVRNNASTWWNDVKTWWNKKSEGGVTVTAKVTSFVDAIKDKTLNFKANITSFLGNAKEKVKRWLGLATGGIYKNGRWQPIEGYASGGRPRSARLFFANENGMPELVGRIGSSTAVMNNGQIVASVAAGVYRAVAAAMSQVGGWFRAMSARLGDIPPAIEMLSAMPERIPMPVMATGTVLPPRAVYADGPVRGLTDAVGRLRDALERRDPGQTGAAREAAYNVNVNVDGQTLFRLMLSQGRLRQLQTGGNPFVDLGG